MSILKIYFRRHAKKCVCKTKKSITFAARNAEIAQLVEHNLAKVGVASSNLVFRSLSQFYIQSSRFA